MRTFTHILIISGVLVTIACEKIIDIPLNEADVRIIVEGQMRDSLGNNFIKLSRSGSVYDDSGFEKIMGAVVTVNDGTTNFIFPEDPSEAGTYNLGTFKTEPNKTYTLTVNISGQILTATSQTFVKPNISSLFYEGEYNFFSQFDTTQADTTYHVYCDFLDDGTESNFYRINAWVNGEKDDTYYILNDKLFNGENNVSSVWGASIEAGDTIDIELVSMDQARYKYLYTLANNAVGGPFTAAPGNPVSNIKGDGIGYFSAFTIDTMQIVIPL